MKGCIEWRLPDIDVMLVGPEPEVRAYRLRVARMRTALEKIRGHLTGGAEFETMAAVVDDALGGKTHLP